MNENELLRKALAMYAGEHVVERVLAGGESFLVPSAQTVELTLLYYDIGSVSRVEGQVTPEMLFDWQRAYAEATTSAIAKLSGAFEAFLGDAGSAWWMAREHPDHAEKAVACAQALMDAMDDLNQRGAQSRWPAVHLRIGIHTGEAALGNYGSSTRLRFCAMGNAVNLAAYLSRPEHRLPIVLTKPTYDLLRSKSHIERAGMTPANAGAMEIFGFGRA